MKSLRRDVVMMVALLTVVRPNASAVEPAPDTYVIVELENGKVTDAHLTKSTGDAKLDAATIEEFKRWRSKADKKVHQLKIPIHAQPIPNVPHLSEFQVIHIADKVARSAVHRDFREFARSAVYYNTHDANWSVWYKNVKLPSSEFCVRVSDITKTAEVVKNLIRLDTKTSNQWMEPVAQSQNDRSLFYREPAHGSSLFR